MPIVFRMSATTQLKFIIEEHMKNTPDEQFCKLFFVNPKSDPRHAHNKAKKYNHQQVTKITTIKMNSFNLEPKKFIPVIEHASNASIIDSSKTYIDELYDLYENKEDNDNKELIKKYSKMILNIFTLVLSKSKVLLIQNIGKGDCGDKIRSDLKRAGVVLQNTPLTKTVKKQ